MFKRCVRGADLAVMSMAVGYAVAIAIFVGAGAGSLLVEYLGHLSIGALFGLGIAAKCGARAYPTIMRSRLGALLAGVAVAEVSLLLTVLLGSTLGLLLYGRIDAGLADEFISYVLLPLGWIGFVGFLPAAVLGALYGGICRSSFFRGPEDSLAS